MANEQDLQAVEMLKALEVSTDDPTVKRAIQMISGVIVNGSIGVAVGQNIVQNIRIVIEHLDLPANIVATLIEIRNALGESLGLDHDRYKLGSLIADKAHDFVGREHVFKAIDEFFANESRGYFVIEGDPGMGKSAILAEYLRRTGCIAHFNVQSLGVNKGWQFLEHVCTQLIVNYDLSYATLPPNATKDGEFLLRLLEEASAKLKPNERLVIAIDALDEVDLSAHPAGVNILHLPLTLPTGVYFVMTKRPVDLPLVIQTPQHLLDMMLYPAENRRDIEIHLEYAAERPELRIWIDKQNLTVARFIPTLADLSESNFMYLHYVLPEIEKGTYQNLNIESLPIGLEGYYDDHWQRMGMAAKPLPRVKIRIVYILSEVRQPVSRKLIAQFADSSEMEVDELMVQEVLNEWDQFLHDQSYLDGTRYSIYHSSFRDFLHRKDIVQAAGVTIQGIHKLIADDLWNDLFG